MVSFGGDLVPARLIVRENRFLARVEIGGRANFAHIPNTGRLKEILTEGRRLHLAHADNPGRKTRYTVLLAEMGGVLVSIDSNVVNRMVEEYLAEKKFSPFSAYDDIKREWSKREWRHNNSRFDLFLSRSGSASPDEVPDLVIEVKGVTLMKDGVALFPDAVTLRGRKHLLELVGLKGTGYRAAVIFVAQREDVTSFSPNAENDPRFAEVLLKAKNAGVEIYSFASTVTLNGIEISGEIPANL